MKKSVVVLGFCLISVGIINAQQMPRSLTISASPAEEAQLKSVKSHDLSVIQSSPPSFYKRKPEWRKIIDSTWGPGLPLAQKLSVFDYYANYVRRNNPTFTYTKLNWDSVSAYWRSKITDSTSRGGFSAILSYLARQLTDLHAFAHDSVLLSTPLNPGTPILVDGQYDFLFAKGDSRFGAGLTPLPDSSLLVYVVAPNHPLGLEPGDIVLGYEGVPWRKIVRELTAAEIPVIGPPATCPSASAHYMLYCAGMNWHLFDTIDVVKYKTGQTVHLRTDTLLTLNVATPFVNGAQIPVAGVPMPGWSMKDGFPNSPAVTYGIVQGKNIGYIYVYHGGYENVGAEFNAAVTALAQTHGLIIDIRFNAGGGGLNAGIARLTGYAGPTLAPMARSSPTDLWSLTPMPSSQRDIPQDLLRYENPIAVLLGPTCASGGDVTARQLIYLDNVRVFGKSPNGGCGGLFNSQPYAAGFQLFCADVTLVDHRFPNTPLWGQEFPIDEQVWLTKDGVAKGEDGVVKRALAWITTLSYAHDVQLSQPSRDTLRITARVENPLAHALRVVVTLRDDPGALIDSVALKDDGLHSDGAANDSIWGCTYVPGTEGTIHASIRTDDPTAGTSRILADASQIIFAHGALITLDASTADLGKIVKTLQHRDTTITVRNIGFAADSLTILLDPVNVDPATAVAVSPSAFFLAAHDSQKVTFSIQPQLLVPQFYQAIVTVQPKSGYGQTLLSKSFIFEIVTAGAASSFSELPTEFVLGQNYPNPFNPSTTIKYDLPKSSEVRLSVYDILGREVSTLVHERREAGVHEVKFDALGLSSGVYFYRLTVGDFVATKRLLLLQ